MKRPELDKIPLVPITSLSGIVITMSVGQWDKLLENAYNEGMYLFEFDKNELPVAIYKKGGLQ